MATKKSGSTASKANSKKTAGSATRKRGSVVDQTTGVGAKPSVVARPRKKPVRTLSHKQPARAGAQKSAEVSLRGALLMPIATPPRDRLREVERIIGGGGEVTIVEGKSSVKVAGETLAAMRQIIAALSSGPLSLLLGDKRDTELTSQEVADLLNVSRPHVVKLAREGEIPHKMVGNRHRFMLSDVQEYERRHRLGREQALSSIVPDAGYTSADF